MPSIVLKCLSREITEYYQDYQVSKNLIELRNLVLVSEMIVRCAMERKESRGLHFTLDYPEQAARITKNSPKLHPISRFIAL